MNYLDKRKLIKSGYNLPILGFGAAPFMPVSYTHLRAHET